MKVSHEDNYIAPEYARIVETRLANEGFLVASRQVPVFSVEFLVFSCRTRSVTWAWALRFVGGGDLGVEETM